MHEAKTQFSKLVASALNGEEIIITKSGKSVVKLVPILSEKPKRRIGVLKGEIKIADDSDAPLPEEILRSFKGRLGECF